MAAVAIPLNPGLIEGRRDNFDRTVKFFEQFPKDCLKTLRYTIEWAIKFFNNLSNFPGLSCALTAFKNGIALFAWPEFLKDLNVFRLKTVEWFNGSEKSFRNVVSACGDVVHQVCDLAKWFFDTSIFAFAAKTLTALTLVNGISMMISMGNRMITNLWDFENGDVDRQSLNLWKFAKHTSIFAIGVLLTISAIFTFFNPAYMLVCSTASLVASFGAYIADHPLIAATPA